MSILAFLLILVLIKVVLYWARAPKGEGVSFDVEKENSDSLTGDNTK